MEVFVSRKSGQEVTKFSLFGIWRKTRAGAILHKGHYHNFQIFRIILF